MHIDHKLHTHTFQKRSTGSAGFLFLANILALILAVSIIGFVNKRRKKRGIKPIYGTHWMIPPSYRQSQNQYDQPDHIRDPDLPSAYVPTYTATTTEYDMGHYDESGKFHPNPNVKNPIPLPPQVHQRSDSNSGGDVAPISNNFPSSIAEADDETESIGDLRRPLLTDTRPTRANNNDTIIEQSPPNIANTEGNDVVVNYSSNNEVSNLR